MRSSLIRPATSADAEAVSVLDSDCFGPSAWSRASWADEFARHDRRILVCADPEVAGYVVLIVPEDPRDPVDLARIAVASGTRRTGLGAALLSAALDEVRGRTVLLEVAEGNEAAIALYRRAGFGEISRRTRYYGDEDALIMRWEIDG
ncbi:MAG TPA: N-acetyltransferase [Kribbellaceae bacterium]|nr:N-acetyltransferase [Kribbellaceae bacterium]